MIERNVVAGGDLILGVDSQIKTEILEAEILEALPEETPESEEEIQTDLTGAEVIKAMEEGLEIEVAEEETHLEQTDQEEDINFKTSRSTNF